MEGKGIGSALIEVFDAVVALIKAEVNVLINKFTAIAKEKGIGVVLLLGALAPLTLGAIFLVLFVFFGLMRLGLGAWAAALVLAVVSIAAAGGMVMFGLQKLSAEVEHDEPVLPTAMPIQRDEIPGLVIGSSANGSVPISDLRVPVPATSSELTGRHGHVTEHTHHDSHHNQHAHGGAHGHHHEHDPNIQQPVVLRDVPPISVSTQPTFRDDMTRGTTPTPQKNSGGKS